ncbi:triose-phosphate isomerase family protein [Collinsella sp. An307]|uniref:triose-phosphate isomerase n=1 Tax=Collinsella sp. An307 TaxID=1965630 RepID=UPI000B3B04D9|nr:triose-phosphate isomerase family protein [Collinsella sp. An307]OUO21274.1 triose-phosphate isomerase [Collinsella sp. An307]
MKHIFLNLKRFDIKPELGGVNRLAEPERWGEAVTSSIKEVASRYADAEFAAFLPEAHLTSAVAGAEGSPLGVGCQGVHTADTAPGGNFGAFTTLRTGNAVAQLGCTWALIGHCEERMNLRAIMGEAGADPEAVEAAVNRILAREVAAAQAAGLKVLFCMGEREEEVDRWDEVLATQVREGLAEADLAGVRVAYEPVWSIGPGKTPADAPYIQKVARLIKETVPGVDVVYGGGLKADNAEMLAGIPEIDGGLIALTRFTGEIGFYPEEYAEIVDLYMNA